jgi:hypothetical protein
MLAEVHNSADLNVLFLIIALLCLAGAGLAAFRGPSKRQSYSSSSVLSSSSSLDKCRPVQPAST